MKMELEKSQLKYYFEYIKQNLRKITRELNENVSEDELNAMISEFDRDQDGCINQQEFMYIMKQTAL